MFEVKVGVTEHCRSEADNFTTCTSRPHIFNRTNPRSKRAKRVNFNRDIPYATGFSQSDKVNGNLQVSFYYSSLIPNIVAQFELWWGSLGSSQGSLLQRLLVHKSLARTTVCPSILRLAPVRQVSEGRPALPLLAGVTYSRDHNVLSSLTHPQHHLAMSLRRPVGALTDGRVRAATCAHHLQYARAPLSQPGGTPAAGLPLDNPVSTIPSHVAPLHKFSPRGR